jgi:hypothetical protein
MNLLKNGKIKTSVFFQLVADKINIGSHRFVAQIYQGTKQRPQYIYRVRKAVRETPAQLNRAGIDVSWHQPMRW